MASIPRSAARPATGATRARQGQSGRHVLWVLIFGTALVVLGFAAAYLWSADDLASANANNGPARPAEASGWNAPEPAPQIPQPAQTTQR